MNIRINKFLSLCGVASRRTADQMILDGRVKVNGKTILTPGLQVAKSDSVEVDSHPVHLILETSVILFHKPPGCICTQNDPEGRRTVYDYLPSGYREFKYIGRLDFQSRGMLLFTNNGELAHRLTHPSFQIKRTYFVWTNRPLTQKEKRALLNGIEIEPGIIGRSVEIFSHPDFTELTLTEGKNREIRKMMEALQIKVRDLKRVSFAGIALSNLGAGEYRELSPQEIKQLKRQVGMDS